MAIYHQGANYENQAEIQRRDRIAAAAFDDLASQVAVIREQGNFAQKGTIAPPSSPAAIRVTALNGLFSASIQHNSPPDGTRYVLQYSPSPNFPSGATFTEVIESTPGIVTTWQKYLPNQGLYFRVAAKFPASSLGAWVYLGSQPAPVLVQASGQ